MHAHPTMCSRRNWPTFGLCCAHMKSSSQPRKQPHPSPQKLPALACCDSSFILSETLPEHPADLLPGLWGVWKHVIPFPNIWRFFPRPTCYWLQFDSIVVRECALYDVSLFKFILLRPRLQLVLVTVPRTPRRHLHCVVVGWSVLEISLQSSGTSCSMND